MPAGAGEGCEAIDIRQPAGPVRTVLVAAAALVDADNRVLLARRPPGKPMAGPPLGFPTGPEDLLVEEDGTPRRIDKAFSWQAPIAAHGMMHMVVRNAWARDPYPIDVLFMFMANMSWNSAMNTAETMEMLAATDASGEYLIPKIIVAPTAST